MPAKSRLGQKGSAAAVPHDWRIRPTLPFPLAAQLLGLSTMSIYSRVAAGDLIAVRLGGRVSILTESLIAYLEREAGKPFCTHPRGNPARRKKAALIDHGVSAAG